MRYRQLDSAGDMRFGHQQYDFYRDQAEAVAQAVMTRLMLWTGEWYLDTSEGMEWQGGVLGTGTGLTADSVIRDRILNTDGVTGIVDGTYSSATNRDTRKLTVSCTIDTVYGTAQVTA